MLLREFLKPHDSGFGKTRMVLSIPCRSTAVERKAVEDVAHTCGAKETYVIEEPLAAALGSGIGYFRPERQNGGRYGRGNNGNRRRFSR